MKDSRGPWRATTQTKNLTTRGAGDRRPEDNDNNEEFNHKIH